MVCSVEKFHDDILKWEMKVNTLLDWICVAYFEEDKQGPPPELGEVIGAR